MQFNPKILQVSRSDLLGGAEKIAFDLHSEYANQGLLSWMVVGSKHTDAKNVIELPSPNGSTFSRMAINLRNWASKKGQQGVPGAWHLSHLADWLTEPKKKIFKFLGYEMYSVSGFPNLIDLLPKQPDIVHLHNLHSGYFNLQILPKLSKKIPVVITLHDMWLLTGHCVYSLDCERWKFGCGSCPYLSIPMPIKRDGTRRNIRVKTDLLRKSEISIVTPSQWLMDLVDTSGLKPKETRVIPNGIDDEIFKPGSMAKARHLLNLPQDSVIILYVTNLVVKVHSKIMACWTG